MIADYNLSFGSMYDKRKSIKDIHYTVSKEIRYFASLDDKDCVKTIKTQLSSNTITNLKVLSNNNLRTLTLILIGKGHTTDGYYELTFKGVHDKTFTSLKGVINHCIDEGRTINKINVKRRP